MDFFLSLDIGTTSVKAALVGADGEIPAIAVREYTLHTPAENIVELEPQIYWDCCVEGIKEVLAKGGVAAGQIKSVGVCSQGETLICLDEKGRALRKAIVWMDNRSASQAEEIKAALKTENNTGQLDVAATWPVTKILWLKKNEPETYGRVHKFVLVEDYILYRLTGLFKGEYSLYTSSFMLDIINKRWWTEILDYVGVAAERLVELCESGEVIGEVQPAVCKETGLAEGMKVVTGAMDQTAAMIGAGNIKSGIVTETTGAALAVCGTIGAFAAKEAKRTMAVQYHAIADKYLIIGWCPTGGMAFRWLRDTLFATEKDRAAKTGTDAYDRMTALAAEIPPGSRGLIFLPYLAGPGTGNISADARGVFYGLELHHNRADFARAVMESVAFVLKQYVVEMGRLGLECGEIRSLGGGSKSRLWNRIKADVLGKPVTTMRCAEAAALGVAILQAAAMGTFKTIEQAVKNMVRTESVVEPVEENVRAYSGIFEKFCEINNRCFGPRED